MGFVNLWIVSLSVCCNELCPLAEIRISDFTNFLDKLRIKAHIQSLWSLFRRNVSFLRLLLAIVLFTINASKVLYIFTLCDYTSQIAVIYSL